MTDNTQSTDKKVRWLITALIVVAGVFSSTLSFNGIYMYSQDHLVSFAIAAVVQLSLITLILVAPRARGVSLSIGIFAYLLLMMVSSFTAYVYIHGAKEGPYVHRAEDIELTNLVSSYISETLRHEREWILHQEDILQGYLARREEEEKSGNSGERPPGKGAVWREWNWKVQTQTAEVARLQKGYAALEQSTQELQGFMRETREFRADRQSQNFLGEAFLGLFMATPTDVLVAQRHNEVVAQLQDIHHRLESNAGMNVSMDAIMGHLLKKNDPVNTALSSLEEGKWKTNSVFAYLVYASIFDFAMLVMGGINWVVKGQGGGSLRQFLRHVIDEMFALPTNIVEAVWLNAHKVILIPRRVKQLINRERGEIMALVNEEIWILLAGVVAACRASLPDLEGDVRIPVLKLFSLMEPLHLEGSEDAIGIRFERLEGENKHLIPIICVFIKENLMIPVVNQECYRLNPDNPLGFNVWLYLMANQERGASGMPHGFGPLLLGRPGGQFAPAE